MSNKQRIVMNKSTSCDFNASRPSNSSPLLQLKTAPSPSQNKCFRSLNLISILLGVGLVVSPYRLPADMALADGVDVALKGRQARDVQVGEHRFHIGPIVVTRTANQIAASGIIFHV